MGGVITFTSDFGLTDVYVGSVKGAIKTIAPDVDIIDITHGIERGDIVGGGLALASACRYFPTGTVHLAVVDPGVGTDRGIIAAELDEYFYVAPDNGLLGRVAARTKSRRFVYVENERYFRQPVSATFNGRDVMGPVAAHLAAGVAMTDLGPAVREIVADGWEPARVRDDGTVMGKVVAVDHFGNCITNIAEADLRVKDAYVRAGDCEIPVARTFGDVAPGSAVAYVGSAGYLEVAVNMGSAARKLPLGRGDQVSVKPPS